MWLLGATVLLRPYVFAFLLVYLALAAWHLGLARAAAFLVLALLFVLGGLAVIPYYFAKRGRESQPGSYTLEQLKDPKDQERK